MTQAGTYTATLSYGAACTATVRQRVRAGVAVPTAFTLGADTTLCEGGQVLLRALAVGRAVALRWSDGSTGTTLRVTQPGTYSLQLTGECDTRTASRRVEYRPCLAIPNIVTANDDGRNDYFAIGGLALGLWKLEVYSRWGEKVYETAAYHNDWGDQAAAGMYYYLLRRGDAAATYKGWVEVVR